MKLELWVERSFDGETLFTEAADILDALGQQYEARGQMDVACFFFTRALEARKIDQVYEQKDQPWRST